MKAKLAKIIKVVSAKAFRQIITLVVMLKSKDIPAWVKVSIIGALGYLICPYDLIPDFIPGGLVEDLAVISILLSEISVYNTDNIEDEVDNLMIKFKLNKQDA
jgi:uncharacterized membrane protein YkvA (DUF1232 family)